MLTRKSRFPQRISGSFTSPLFARLTPTAAPGGGGVSDSPAAMPEMPPVQLRTRVKQEIKASGSYVNERMSSANAESSIMGLLTGGITLVLRDVITNIDDLESLRTQVNALHKKYLQLALRKTHE